MSDLALLLAPDQTNKPWAKLFIDTLTTKFLNITQSFTVQSLEVKGNLQVDGYINSPSDQETAGTIQISDTMLSVALPAGTGGADFSNFNPLLTKVIFSGLSGGNTAVATVNGGATWTQLTTPFANPTIEYSPDLNIYSGLDGAGTAVYTSPSAVNGSWVLGTPYPGPGTLNDFGTFIWNSVFGRFYIATSDPAFAIASSTTGSSYFPQAATRLPIDFSYAPAASGLGLGQGRLVGVGAAGPLYTDDGKTWINSNSNASMSSVAWSPFWKVFVALPRGGVFSNVFRSVDGINWTSTNAGFDLVNSLRALTWIPQFQLFVASGDNGVFWISKDGLSWRRLSFTPAVSSYASAYFTQWGNFMSGGIGGNVAITNQRYLF